MKKGTFGIRLSFYAVLAFVLAFGADASAGAFARLCHRRRERRVADKADHAGVLLTIAVSVVRGALELISMLFSWIPSIGSISVSSIVLALFDWVNWAVSVVALIFIIIAVFKVLKGGEANVPLCASLANRAYGIVKKSRFIRSSRNIRSISSSRNTSSRSTRNIHSRTLRSSRSTRSRTFRRRIRNSKFLFLHNTIQNRTAEDGAVLLCKNFILSLEK